MIYGGKRLFDILGQGDVRLDYKLIHKQYDMLCLGIWKNILLGQAQLKDK